MNPLKPAPSQKVIRVFAASPGDMADERQRLAKVIAHLSDQMADAIPIRFELKEWRQVAPGMGRPEDVILDQLPVETWDVFIGLLWLRFGMPPGKNRAGVNHDSGTEEEFRLAHRAWQETQRPRILFYRCTRPAPVDVDAKQLAKVQKFFKQFAPDGENPGLFQDFGETDQFEKMVEKHLTGLLIEEYKASELPPRMQVAAARGCPQPQQLGTEQAARTSSPARPAHAAAGEGARAPDAWRNPFIVGVPITDPADFFGREREISFCLARLRGMQSVSITGERRIGKSSLLHYLTATARERLGPEYRPAYVDLLSAAARTLPGLLGEILRQLGVKRPAATLTEFEQRLNELHDQGGKPLVALDELEMFVRLGAKFCPGSRSDALRKQSASLELALAPTHDFCETLRALASGRRLALLTASRANLQAIQECGALVSPLHNIMGTWKLGPFMEADAREFVTAPRPGVRFSEEQAAEILRRGERHPLRLQVLCFHVAQANHEKRSDWPGVWTEAEAEAATMLELPRTAAGREKA